jgi:hypothetical protein
MPCPDLALAEHEASCVRFNPLPGPSVGVPPRIADFKERDAELDMDQPSRMLPRELVTPNGASTLVLFLKV